MRLIHPKALLALSVCAGLFQSFAIPAAVAAKHAAEKHESAKIKLSDEQKAVHVLNRLAYGPRPGDVEAVKQMGISHFIQSQLYPETVQEDPTLNARLSQIEAINLPPLQLFMKYGLPVKTQTKDQSLTPDELRQLQKQRREQVQDVLGQARSARVLRALYSNHQLQEVMTEFWYNHFNIYGGKGLDAIWIGNYEETAIRPYALGKFRDLLESTSHHAAMQFYLDNWQNSAPPPDQDANSNNTNNGNKKKGKGLNENYARELMELHTLGVDGGYTQDDVISLAHILTGWGIVPTRILLLTQQGSIDSSQNPKRQALQQQAFSLINGNGYYFDDKRHDFADKQFLGTTIKGSGEAEGEQALDILARHPSTAKFISTKLAQYFVSDQPSPELVSRLTKRFQQTDGDIRAVLQTLFESPEFWDPANVGHKYKTPYRYVISTSRAINAPVDNPRPLLFAMNQQGMQLYGCETPNGYKYTQDAWLSPDGMTQRINFAMAVVANQLRIRQIPSNPANSANNGTNSTNGNTPLINAETLAETLTPTLGASLSDHTQSAILAAPQALRPSLILSSPEFMNY